MTDKKNIAARAAAESRSRSSKLSQKKITKTRAMGLKESQSPSYRSSYGHRKDYTTPKRRPRRRFNGSYSGDSPNDTDALQDIIWDPNSPTQSFTGNGGDGRVIEISEIVNRIAPKVERPVEGDSVLQWIGDSAVPCTPEVRQPRVRRISARQSNVDDLMKLAKQFDINMTRQDNERNLEKQQESTDRRTEDLNKLNKSQSDGTTRGKQASVPVTSKKPATCSSQGRREEEELQALFDGPTQHLSGRLSPPSVSCTPEGKTDPATLAGQRICSAEITNIPVDAPKTTGVDFDDDWENDDLINDSFVLEMTQNPVPLDESCNKKSNFVTKTNTSVSNARNICSEQSTSKSSTYNRMLPKDKSTAQSTFRLKPATTAQDQNTKKLLKTAHSTGTKTIPGEHHQTRSLHSKVPVKLERRPKDCGTMGQTSTAKFDGVSEEDMKSLFDSDGLWNDKDDDELLFQVCDDVERISASQEQQKHMDHAKKAQNKSKSSTPKEPSSTDTVHTQTTGIKSKGRPPDQPTEPTKSKVFARSNSVPCSSTSSAFKQDFSALPTTKVSNSYDSRSHIPHHYGQGQNKFTHVNSTLGHGHSSVRASDSTQTVTPHSRTGGNASNSSHSTFKRHLSDSVTLTNKVFVSSHMAVKCSAAEIERKKQEAIARRRSRMQASKTPGAPT